MRIVIVGAGNIGTQLAEYLIQEKHDVSIIESDEERARHVSNRIDCMVIHDNGNNLKALEEAGTAKADALVCVTDSDEVNMIICGLATSNFNGGAKKLLKIARVRNDDYVHLSLSDNRKALGIDHFIHPTMEMARSIIKDIEHGVTGDIVTFSNTPFELGSIDIPTGSAFDGLILSDYPKLVPLESMVTLIERDEDVLIPTASTALKNGDRVFILADSKNLHEIFRIIGLKQKPIRKIGIVGGSKLGSLIAEGLLNKTDAADGDAKRRKPGKWNFLFSLSKLLMPKSRRIIIIEKEIQLCKDLAARFPEALILNQNISDETFINEEQLDGLDCLITTTSNQDMNIIAAVYLKSRGIARTIAMVDSSGYAAMARRLGVDVAIPMKSVVVDTILSHLMGSGVKDVKTLGDGKVDIMEIEIEKNSPAIKRPVSEFKLYTSGLLLLVTREEKTFIPGSGYFFGEGDRIIIIARTDSQVEIRNYFKADH